MKKLMSFAIISAGIVILLMLSANAAIINVPANQTTIQMGIDAADTGDIVMVAPGTYYENITMRGGIKLVGSGAASTIIDGSNSTPVICLDDVQGVGIRGFTIRNGYNPSAVIPESGGGIRARNSSCEVSACIIEYNYSYRGAGVSSLSSSVAIRNCLIRDNDSVSAGGVYFLGNGHNLIENCIVTRNTAQETRGAGLFVHRTNATIKDCIISHNEAYEAGSAICISDQRNYPPVKITNTIINDNIVTNPFQPNHSGSAVYAYYHGKAELKHCTIYNNSTAGGASEVSASHTTSTSISLTNCIVWGDGDDLYNCSATYSDIEDGDAGVGNFSAYPEFVNLAAGNFHLLPSSPCINAGTNAGVIEDIDGDSRPFGAGFDVGADEFVRLKYVLKARIHPPWYNTEKNVNHCFSIILKTDRPLPIHGGEMAKVSIDINNNGIFEPNEKFPAGVDKVVGGKHMQHINVTVFPGNRVQNNNPAVAIWSIGRFHLGYAEPGGLLPIRRINDLMLQTY